MKQPDSKKPQPFAGAGGTTTPPTNERDPYEALDDLMTVIEALCPTWPQRDTFSDDAEFLL